MENSMTLQSPKLAPRRPGSTVPEAHGRRAVDPDDSRCLGSFQQFLDVCLIFFGAPGWVDQSNRFNGRYTWGFPWWIPNGGIKWMRTGGIPIFRKPLCSVSLVKGMDINQHLMYLIGGTTLYLFKWFISGPSSLMVYVFQAVMEDMPDFWI